MLFGKVCKVQADGHEIDMLHVSNGVTDILCVLVVVSYVCGVVVLLHYDYKYLVAVVASGG